VPIEKSYFTHSQKGITHMIHGAVQYLVKN